MATTGSRDYYSCDVVGRRCGILFDMGETGKRKFFSGLIQRFQATLQPDGTVLRLHHILFDDGDEWDINLRSEENAGRLEWEEEDRAHLQQSTKQTKNERNGWLPSTATAGEKAPQEVPTLIDLFPKEEEEDRKPAVVAAVVAPKGRNRNLARKMDSEEGNNEDESRTPAHESAAVLVQTWQQSQQPAHEGGHSDRASGAVFLAATAALLQPPPEMRKASPESNQSESGSPTSAAAAVLVPPSQKSRQLANQENDNDDNEPRLQSATEASLQRASCQTATAVDAYPAASTLNADRSESLEASKEKPEDNGSDEYFQLLSAMADSPPVATDPEKDRRAKKGAPTAAAVTPNKTRQRSHKSDLVVMPPRVADGADDDESLLFGTSTEGTVDYDSDEDYQPDGEALEDDDSDEDYQPRSAVADATAVATDPETEDKKGPPAAKSDKTRQRRHKADAIADAADDDEPRSLGTSTEETTDHDSDEDYQPDTEPTVAPAVAALPGTEWAKNRAPAVAGATGPPEKKRKRRRKTKDESSTPAPAWVNDMAKWLQTVPHGPKNSVPNTRNAEKVIRQVSKLATGQGISKQGKEPWPEGVCFYEGRKVDLKFDFDKMLQEAKYYEDRYGKDLGNGWLLLIPIKKLKLFKDYVEQCHVDTYFH